MFFAALLPVGTRETAIAVAVVALLGLLIALLLRQRTRNREAESKLLAIVDTLERALAERDAANAALRAEQARFQAIVDNAPVAVTVTGLDGRYGFVNHEAARWWELSGDTMLGRRMADVLPASEATVQAEWDQEVLAQGAPISRDTEITLPSGTRHVLAIKFPVFDLADTLSGLGLVMVDVTAQRRMEAELAQSQKMDAVGQLTGGIAHDFNNLLTAILLNSDILTRRLASDLKLHPLAQVILEAAERGAELTRRLLAFSRRQVLEARPTDVNSLVLGLEQLLRRSLGEHIDISLVLTGDVEPARVDAGQLETALLNLAVNARDAMPDGGRLTIETANITFETADAAMVPDLPPGHYVMVAVSDTGAGMSPEVKARVFEPFFTTKPVGKGTGLGLSMVYGFVKQSGGQVTIYSEPGTGTVVKLYLPMAEAPADSVRELVEAPAALPRGSEVILLVEDDRLVRINAEQQLRGLGYEVVAAENGPDALAAIDRGVAPDLLFTDVVMPGGLTGIDLAQRLRVRMPGLRVLFTSGYTHGATAHDSGALADEHFLGKPFRSRDLARKVREALDNNKAT